VFSFNELNSLTLTEDLKAQPTLRNWTKYQQNSKSAGKMSSGDSGRRRASTPLIYRSCLSPPRQRYWRESFGKPRISSKRIRLPEGVW
jgi:hypothetical protein